MHVIHSELPLELAEGAFSVRKDWAGSRPCDRIASERIQDQEKAAAHGACGSSAIFALKGYTRGEVVHTEPNTNLIWPRCVLPMLLGEADPGETVLLCAVFSDPEDRMPENIPESVRAAAAALEEQILGGKHA